MGSFADEIARRAKLDNNFAELVEVFVEKYHLNVSIDSVKNGRVFFTDLNGKSVSIYLSDIRSGKLHCVNPASDILVFATGDPPMFIGWTFRENLQDADDRFLVGVKVLYNLPDTFVFVRPCPHMEEFGGFYNETDGAWECFGCGSQLVG